MKHTAYCRANAAGSGNSVCTCVIIKPSLPNGMKWNRRRQCWSWPWYMRLWFALVGERAETHKEQCACKRCLGVRQICRLIVGLAFAALIDVALATLIYGVAVAWLMR